MANIIFNIAGLLILLSFLLTLYRLIKGPTIADRAVAIDTMTIAGISLIVFLAAMFKRIIYVDVAIVYAIISFVGIVVIARYLERGL